MHVVDSTATVVRRQGPGEFTFAALASGGIAVLALGNAMASGEPALSLLGSFAVALLLLGVAGSFVALRGVDIAVDAPRDVTVGSDAEIRIGIHGVTGRQGAPVVVRLLDPPTTWHDARVGDVGGIRWMAPRRGVWQSVRVELRSSWPFGMFQRRKVYVVTLDHPMYVTPRPLAMTVAGSTHDDDGHRPSGAPSFGGDLVRSVRPYRVGDPPRWVHWPSTARSRELMVREFEPMATHDVTLRVTLAPDPVVAEAGASRAMGAGQSVLRSGRRLVVATVEERGPKVASVATERELGRRLARAVTGVPPEIAVAGVVEIS